MRRTVTTTFLLTMLSIPALIAPAVATASAPSPGCTAAGKCTVVFAPSGNVQTWVVPANVARISVVVGGARGYADNNHRQYAGLGGIVRADVRVAPNSTISLVVGATPQKDDDQGGGGSYLFRSGRPAVIAGGGGNWGYDVDPGSPPYDFAHGGNGGAGSAGTDAEAGGGTGATTVSPGECGGDPNVPENCTSGTGPTTSPSNLGQGGAGGGGGGYYGGGGGAVSGTVSSGAQFYAAGGGSGYLAPDVVLTGANVNFGTGKITITYQR